MSNCPREAMRLYAVTDRAWLRGQTLYEQVEAALRGGVTCVQLREKHLPFDEFLRTAKEIKSLPLMYRRQKQQNCTAIWQLPKSQCQAVMLPLIR